MAFINKIGNFLLGTVLISQPTGVWERIIMAFNKGITNYGWAIIVFTLVLKTIMSPLDFLNRRTTEKNTKLQKIIQPEIAKIQKQYGNNKQMINQKTMEIYKKYNYNVTGSCLVMIFNLGLTLFVFISLFAGLNSMASYKVGYQYQEIEKTYNQVAYGISGEADIETDYERYLVKYEEIYNIEIAKYLTGEEMPTDATSEEKAAASLAAKEAAGLFIGTTEEELLRTINISVLEKYNKVKESWLWVKNIWRPDNPWTKTIPTFSEYTSMAGITYKDVLGEGETESFKIRLMADKVGDQATYENIMAAIENENVVNGYLIIPILAVALTILSMLASQGKIKFNRKKKEKNEEKAMPNPMGGLFMVILLGGLMGYITVIYNSVFALYILVSSLFGFITAPLINLLIKRANEWQEKRKSKKVEIKTPYKRK